jgi:hypothetical protein
MEEDKSDFSNNGMQTRVWGPAGWIFLHCIAQNYPKFPTQEQKNNYKIFFRQVGNVLPCRYCRESYQQFINDPDTLLNDTVMENRQTFTLWLYRIHNKVNKKLGIKDPITFKQVSEKYESFRSKCTKSPEIKLKKGCTDPLKGYRKACKVQFVNIDINGKPLNNNASFGATKSKSIKLKSIKKSTKSDKKLMATFEINGRQKVIHFGAKGMSDFTKHHDRERRKRYIKRHSKDLKTRNPIRAGFLSMFVLWNKQSLSASISDYRRRLGIYNRTGKFPVKIN